MARNLAITSHGVIEYYDLDSLSRTTAYQFNKKTIRVETQRFDNKREAVEEIKLALNQRALRRTIQEILENVSAERYSYGERKKPNCVSLNYIIETGVRSPFI